MQRLEPYAGQIHRFVARRVRNSADAADIAQQTLLQACTKIDTCRGEDLAPWLRTIARHLIVDHYRASQRFQFVEAAALAETEPALRTPWDAVPAHCERRARLSCVMSCITRRLRLGEQVAVLLADVHGYRDKESAAVLRMSLPSFKLLLHEARGRLQEMAGGVCMLARKTSAAACVDPGNGHGSRGTERRRGLAHPVRRAARPGVTCRLVRSRLLALRNRLLDELKLLTMGLAHGFEDLACLLEDVAWLSSDLAWVVV